MPKKAILENSLHCTVHADCTTMSALDSGANKGKFMDWIQCRTHESLRPLHVRTRGVH